MSDDQLREALQRAFPPAGDASAWPKIESRGRSRRRRHRLVLSLAGVSLVALIVAGVWGNPAFLRRGPSSAEVKIEAKGPTPILKLPPAVPDLQVQGHLLVWLEPDPSGASETRALDLRTKETVRIPGSSALPDPNLTPATWVAALPDGSDGTRVFGGYGRKGAWEWRPGETSSRTVVSMDEAVLGARASGDVALLRTSISPDKPWGENPMLLVAAEPAVVALDPVTLAPSTPGSIPTNISPYWTPTTKAAHENDPIIHDLRREELLPVDPSSTAPVAGIRVAGTRVAWVTARTGGSVMGDVGTRLHVRELPGGQARTVASVPGDLSVAHFVGSFAMNRDWLIWLEPRHTLQGANPTEYDAAWPREGFDLVGVHLPDLTPFRLQEAVRPGDGVREIGGTIHLGVDTAVFTVASTTGESEVKSVRLVASTPGK